MIWDALYVKYTCSMETVQQNGRFTLFSSKFPSNIYSLWIKSIQSSFSKWPALSPLGNGNMRSVLLWPKIIESLPQTLIF